MKSSSPGRDLGRNNLCYNYPMNNEQNSGLQTGDLPGNNPVELTSSDGEVVLRQFTPQDAEEIFALINRNRGHLSQHGENTANRYPTLESVRESIENPKNPNRLRFAIRNRKGQFIGSINLTPDTENTKQAEVGCYLGAEFSKQGYMTRALEMVTTYGFQNLGYETIYGDVVETNTASSNALLRNGYRQASRFNGKIRYTKQKIVT